jgi:prophage antirepressor-like protein
MKTNNSIILSDNTEVRRQWDEGEKLWYFVARDVINVLKPVTQPSRYWTALKYRLTKEGSDLPNQIKQIIVITKGGNSQAIDAINSQQILRIIQSIHSPKTESLKLWLAQTAFERMQETEDPEKAFERAMSTYAKKGYSSKWINQRLKSIEVRKELTSEWQERGIAFDEFRILTDEITKAWSGKTTREYKDHKGLKSQNLRDNMTNLELVLNMLGEISTKEISIIEKPEGIKSNKKVAKRGGTVAKKARLEIEKQTGQSVISSQNSQNPAQLK